MLVFTTWMLAAGILLAPTADKEPKQFVVDCSSGGDLQSVLDKAAPLEDSEIVLHGVCKGNFVITFSHLTLRGDTPESGLAAADDFVLEIFESQINLVGLVVQGGDIGVLVRGWDSDVVLDEVEVRDQDDIGVVAIRGAQVRLFDSTVHDSEIGILAQTDSEILLDDVMVNNQERGVVVFDDSLAALDDTTIADCSEVGLDVVYRSDAIVEDSVFHANTMIHIRATDWSEVILDSNRAIGDAKDTTTFSLAADSNSTISSFSTPVIYGDVAALANSSLRLGSTALHGDLTVEQFSDAFVREAQIFGTVACMDGSDAICRDTTTGGALGCPSPSCGPAPAAAAGVAPAVPELPPVEVPHLGGLRFHRP